MTEKTKDREDDEVHRAARDKIEGAVRHGGKTDVEGGPRPAAGPHAKPKLTNDSATPGAGSLPRPDGNEVDTSTG